MAMQGSETLFAFVLLRNLMQKGLLSQAEAAAICTEAAEMIRSGTEDGIHAGPGEASARGYEGIAAWLLGQKLPPVDDGFPRG